jgi:hypothetical protein
MEAQAMQNTSPNSSFDNSPLNQGRQTHSRNSLMSVGKTANEGTVSVFTKDSINVFKEEDVLITCKGKPILIGVRDGHGQYQIPLMQQRGQ